jgi:hypothetical protein
MSSVAVLGVEPKAEAWCDGLRHHWFRLCIFKHQLLARKHHIEGPFCTVMAHAAMLEGQR